MKKEMHDLVDTIASQRKNHMANIEGLDLKGIKELVNFQLLL